LVPLEKTNRATRKNDPEATKKIRTSSAAEKEEADRLRAKNALGTRSILLAIAIVIFLFGYMLPNTFGAPLPYYPIGVLATSVYIVLLATAAIVEARAARSRVATERIAAGLALIVIFFVFIVVSPGVLPLEWFAPAFLTVLVSVVAGFILLFAGWNRAHKTLRQMAGEYTARLGSQIWTGTHITFEMRNYHFVLAAGFLGGAILFLLSIMTDNAVFAVSSFPYLIIMVIIAATMKTRSLTKQS
jgi:hypothetical protein